MTQDKRARVEELLRRIPSLRAGQLAWIEKVVRTFDAEYKQEHLVEEVLDRAAFESFGDALRVHHTFSVEPFSKDKFEYVLQSVLRMSGREASLAPRGNRGHDITIDGWRGSLKTQADKGIRGDRIWISKFMELGKGKWGASVRDLQLLREQFLEHLSKYDRILVLRNLRRGPSWKYELVEIPRTLLLGAKDGELEIMRDSKQYPKPGYCHVLDVDGSLAFKLYFDAGSERKLQLKDIKMTLCIQHGSWEFVIPSE